MNRINIFVIKETKYPITKKYSGIGLRSLLCKPMLNIRLLHIIFYFGVHILKQVNNFVSAMQFALLDTIKQCRYLLFRILSNNTFQYKMSQLYIHTKQNTHQSYLLMTNSLNISRHCRLQQINTSDISKYFTWGGSQLIPLFTIMWA